MPAPLVELDGLTFRYRRAAEPAIRDLSLTIERGEVLLIAGPSGCGKSTVIRTINGLIPYAYTGDLEGQVRLEGEPTTELRLRDIGRVVGTLLQDPAKQIVGATVEAELAFGPENAGMAPDEIARRIVEVMEETELGPLAGRQTASLSGGEQQLLAMAGALMQRPSCYVVDEPLANLDPRTASHLLRILRRLADAGHAVVIVEHRVEEALALRPDRILGISDGRATYLGPTSGFFAVADVGAVRLPFEVVLERERATPSSGPTVQVPEGRTDPGESRLAFHDVHVTLGVRPVLRGVSADLRAFEAVAVLGPNGSGKTTLFRTAMQLLVPDSGRVTLDGRDVTGRPVAELARSIGYVFQSPSQMLFARTVREELLFGPRNLGLDVGGDADAYGLDALRRVGLSDEEGILDRPPLTLSFGQQKRLALAIALSIRPRTLILDEPSAGQDHRTSLAFMSEVAAIPGLESAYFITHDVDLALTHADRILVVRDGRIVADGPPAAVVEDADRWHASNLQRTTLMEANLARGRPAGRFLDARSLARAIVAHTEESDVYRHPRP
ncbi:MAG: ABC transporter ATP-binding protein [Candidatus Limnocylindria bacterium]